MLYSAWDVLSGGTTSRACHICAMTRYCSAVVPPLRHKPGCCVGRAKVVYTSMVGGWTARFPESLLEKKLNSGAGSPVRFACASSATSQFGDRWILRLERGDFPRICGNRTSRPRSSMCLGQRHFYPPFGARKIATNLNFIFSIKNPKAIGTQIPKIM